MQTRPAARSFVAWIALVVVYGIVVGAAVRGLRPPAPAPATTAPDRFSEERARTTLRAQTDIGLRVVGTPNLERAAESLVAELRRIPGLEVEVQRAENIRTYEGTRMPYPTFVYRVPNVVARLPGRSHEAVLLDAHFDTAGDSPGAGDDAVGVAAMVETMRALAAGPKLEHSVIVLLNGGEEFGLYGADGFARGHRWARDVRAYIYIDGSAGGRASLILAGPRNGWLIDAYARAAPSPGATVVNQDLVESDLMAHDGDFRPLREAGMVGLSIAPVGDMWSTHTARDDYARVEPGTLQHLGDTTLALVRELDRHHGKSKLPGATDESRRVYFDLFGRVLVKYSTVTARVLGVGALALAALALGMLVRRRHAGAKQIGAGVLWSVLGLVAGLVAALCAGALLSFVLRRPHGWYATPWLIAPAFVAPALAGMLAIHAIWRRRWSRKSSDGGDAILWSAWAAAIIGWSVWLLLATIYGVGAGYLALVQVAPLAAGLLAALRWPRLRLWLALGALVPGAVVFSSLAMPLLRVLVPEIGFLLLPIAGDMVVALLSTLLVLAGAGAAVIVAHQAGAAGKGDLGRAALTMASIGLIGIALCAVHKPWTVERPRRVVVTHIEQQGASALAVRAFDALPLGQVLAGIPEAVPARRDWVHMFFMPEYTHEIPAPPPSFAAPRARVVSSTPGPAGTRSVTVHLDAETPQVYVAIPHARLAGWSLGKLPSLPADPRDPGTPDDDRHFIAFQGFPVDTGYDLRLDLRGEAPVEIEVQALTPVPDAAIEALVRRMPPWTVPWPTVMRVVRTSI